MTSHMRRWHLALAMRLTSILLFALLFGSSAFAADPARKRITLDVTQADIHDVIRMLADVSKLNIVAGEDVSGKVTLRLRNVTWKQAMDVVLNSNGLGYEKQGNIVRVAPLKTLADEAALRATLKKSREVEAPLKTFLIRVNYANAADMVPHVKSMLSDRGTVTYDARTSTLIVRDVE